MSASDHGLDAARSRRRRARVARRLLLLPYDGRAGRRPRRRRVGLARRCRRLSRTRARRGTARARNRYGQRLSVLRDGAARRGRGRVRSLGGRRVGHRPVRRGGPGRRAPQRSAHIARINNSWWFNHRAFGSRARVVYGTVYGIPARSARSTSAPSARSCCTCATRFARLPPQPRCDRERSSSPESRRARLGALFAGPARRTQPRLPPGCTHGRAARCVVGVHAGGHREHARRAGLSLRAGGPARAALSRPARADVHAWRGAAALAGLSPSARRRRDPGSPRSPAARRRAAFR